MGYVLNSLVVVALLASVAFATEDLHGDETDIADGQAAEQSIQQGLQSGGQVNARTTRPLEDVLIGSIKTDIPSNTKISGGDGRVTSSAVSKLQTPGGDVVTGMQDVTFDSNGNVYARKGDRAKFGDLDLSGIESLKRDSAGGFSLEGFRQGNIGSARITNGNGLRSFGQITQLAYAGQIWDENVRGEDWINVVFSPQKVSIKEGSLVDFFRSLSRDFRSFESNLPSQRFTLKQSASLSSDQILLENLKDASVKVGSQLVVESNDSLYLVAGPQRAYLVPINGSLRVSGSTDQSQSPKIRVESADITIESEEAKETMVVPRSVILTIDPNIGIVCFDLDSDSSYLYKPNRIQSSFQLFNPHQHVLCIKRRLGQPIKECAECSTLDLTTDELRSSGTLHYQRLYFTQDDIDDTFTPFILPFTPSRYEVSWEQDSYDLKSTSDDALIRINRLVSFHDRRENGKTHRYVIFGNTSSAPLPTSIRSEFPEVRIEHGVLIQPTVQGTTIRIQL
ncbi:hypothetical protein HY641_03535 [Candidatus Woesearchaeota archaeon]|nr:hypothetical protein [Candidatus Woesearchaeota archaeon]